MDKQFYIYSVDTSAFYNDREEEINKRLLEYRIKKKKYKGIIKTEERIPKDLLQTIKDGKVMLADEIKKNKYIRVLRKDSLKRKKAIVSIFDSYLKRTLGIQDDKVSEDIMIVKTYHFPVLKDIIENGFMYKDEKYTYLSASAGQIRGKKNVFIKEKLYLKYHDTLTCGLSKESINSQGGVNTNKYLAYLALIFSATDPCPDFNIDKTIVVDDMETTVRSLVDFVDDKTYKITRQEMDIPINHTDGIGMILPKKSKKSMMIRLPWVKGLLVPFPFDKFIREAKKNNSEQSIGKVKDIYGKEYDIIEDGIEVIFTKSQFKMWKFYSSWDEYKEKFKKHNCHASKCNEEDERFRKANLNYQMLQTLTDITDEELNTISSITRDRISNVSKDRHTMLDILGVKESNSEKDYFQQGLEIYPELLNDHYSKEVLKKVKDSMVKNARSGKVEIDGYYTFICADLYAFCQFLFLNDSNPIGLLKYGDVFCKLYKDGDKLDCLRSPHLYREHGIRNNVIDKEKTRWFVTKGLYTSCHDPISKLLQFDVDGDKSLVCADETFVNAAERNMKGIVPLYYNMSTAPAQIITNSEIYASLIKAYTGSNIGIYSNNITKIWNSDWIYLDVIKLLCMESNFLIDYAKTLYKPERPQDIDTKIKVYTNKKNPNFFIYAKNKTEENVEEINQSVVNRLQKLIADPRFNFRARNIGAFNYKNLLSKKNKKVIIDEGNAVIDKYKELNRSKRYLKIEIDEEKKAKSYYLYKLIRESLLEICPDVNYVVDILVHYLYAEKPTSSKTTLWTSFGDVLVQNLKKNLKQGLDKGYMQCENCGKRTEQTSNFKKMCESCSERRRKELKLKRQKERRAAKKNSEVNLKKAITP